MVSPHLLRPYSSRQLSLLSGDGQVMVFAVLGGRYAGPTVLVHHPTLLHRMDTLPRHIRTVVFIDEIGRASCRERLRLARAAAAWRHREVREPSAAPRHARMS